jgi:predicted nucleic acid-binding protein
VVVDSSVWIETIFRGKLARACEQAMSRGPVLVPSLVLYEVYKKLKLKTDESLALEVIGAMCSHPVLELSRPVSLLAADLSLEYKLGMADSIVLAHARDQGVDLFTLDNDFIDIPGTRIPRL